jgi:hypothetical protein
VVLCRRRLLRSRSCGTYGDGAERQPCAAVLWQSKRALLELSSSPQDTYYLLFRCRVPALFAGDTERSRLAAAASLSQSAV